MGMLVDAMHKGGPFMWLLLLLLVCAPVLPILAGALAGLRRWTPGMLLWCVPVGLVVFGALGRIQGQIMAREAVMYASLETKSVMLHAGLGVAAYTEWAGWGMAALVLSASALMMALGLAVGAGEGAHLRLVPAGSALLGGCVAAVLVVLAAFFQPVMARPVGPESWLLAAVVLVGAVAVSLAASRGNDAPQDAARLANGRVLVLSLALGSVLAVGVSGTIQGFSQLHEGLARASRDQLVVLTVFGVDAMRAWRLPMAVGVLGLGLAGALACLSGLKHLVTARHLISGGVVALALVVAAGSSAWANLAALQLCDSTIERHLAAQLEGGMELPHSLVLGAEEPSALPLQGFARSVSWQGAAWRPGSVFEGVPAWSLPLEPDEADGLLVLAPGSLPAAALLGARWVKPQGDPAPVRLLLAVDHAMGRPSFDSPWLISDRVGMVELELIPPEAWSTLKDEAAEPAKLDDIFGSSYGEFELPGWDELLFMEGRSDGLAIHHRLESREGVTDIGAALSELYADGSSVRDETVVLVPGSGWKVQDIVSHCLSAHEQGPRPERNPYYEPPVRCAVTEAMPPVFVQRRAQALERSRGGFGALGLMGTPEERAAAYGPGTPGPGANIAAGDSIVLGSLDKGVIQSVIQRHLNQIRYCCQRELTTDPSLAGRIVIKFVVAADGTVSSATVKESTMDNTIVGTCIASRFMRFMFPAPAGGGIVIVSYPFVFQPA